MMNNLDWYWVYVPYLDQPEQHKDTALHAGYIKVCSKDAADAVIAELEAKADSLQRENQILKQYKLAAHSSYGIAAPFKEEHK